MAMSRFEKLFVNRQSKGRRNSRKVRERLENLDTEEIREVLELGCGIGTVSAYLAEAYSMQIVGTDFDPAQIDEARRLNSGRQNLRFQVEDAADLSFQDSSFDLVIAHNVFHHIPAWKAAMSEIRRVLRPLGHLMWLDIVFAKPIRGLLTAVEKDESFFSLDEVKGAFRDANFDERFHERMPLMVFAQHHFVLQRT
jgi:SAM-dependent methyltransferase